MISVRIDEAESRLAELLEASLRGESVFITLSSDEGERLIQLKAIESVRRRPVFGSARGLFTMSEDFDAPLEDFADYQ